MRYFVVLRYIGLVMLINAAFMLLSAAVSLPAGTDSGFRPLLLSGALTAILGVFPMLFVPRTDQIKLKEGYLIVVGAWIVSCVTGAFPYLLWGGEFDITSSWFESVSGFSTTGATILNDIEALPRSLLFWRSCTHWLGGVGVVMFTMIVIPAIGRNRLKLSSAELSPLARDNYNYKSQKVVRILLTTYLALTVAETVLLRVAGMGWFDAVNHAFSTVATGGFSTRNLSVAHFHSAWIEGIIMFFMLLSGIHFGVIYATLTGRHNNMFRSEVTRYYLATFAVGTLLIVASLYSSGFSGTVGAALREGSFQAASYLTTTGFTTGDTGLWPPLAMMVLLVLMLQCGCAGSTSGGMKSDRIWLAFKALKLKVLQQQHPNAVIRLKLDGVTQEDYIVNFAMLFIVAYMFFIAAGTIVFAAAGIDLTTGFSMAVSCMGNVGPGFGEIGPMYNYSHIAPGVKAVCTLLMLVGRLEIFGFIQLFLFNRWR